uniref:Wbp11/ELF5/Saf1 N-terminal domain-containing protein n=1 Tax=Salmo trutta TaxID=8032 RepID=A0A673WB53_SALTR
MGRRSTSSTKSGKFMNPTDQARKEARKRELKKNKKQRMMVRTAVLKMKDPRQIIKDMEKLDEMEFNPVQQPLLNEKVLRDKRKKLRETFERIVRLYERENPDTYKELRKLELDYESNRGKLSLYFDSVKVPQLAPHRLRSWRCTPHAGPSSQQTQVLHMFVHGIRRNKYASFYFLIQIHLSLPTTRYVQPGL